MLILKRTVVCYALSVDCMILHVTGRINHSQLFFIHNSPCSR